MVRFERAITVEGVAYPVGSVVDESTLPAGSMGCLRQGFIVDVVPEPEPEIVSAQEPEPVAEVIAPTPHHPKKRKN